MLLVYSLTSVFSKYAAQASAWSIEFFLNYGMVLLILGFYALVWQQIIKRIPLTIAYANRAITVIWGAVWGGILFQESIAPKRLAGIVMVMCGIVLYSLSERQVAEK